jgi:ectoine hydroxylase-related dioxygenase (phytanoyl-CoA dioxygenase family)
MEYITCWTAIGRTYIDNGCIWVLPKSHKLGLVEHVWNPLTSSYALTLDETTQVPVEMKAGQVAIFSSLTLHKSGPNVSKDTRYGYVPQYHVPNVIKFPDRKPFGDLYPVLRDGKCVAA